MLAAIFPIYAMIGAGWFARKVAWIKPEADASLVKIAVELTLPCFILSNLLDNKKLESVGFSLATISAGAGGLAASLLISWLVGKLIGLKVGDGLRTFSVTNATQNYGFFIIALVAILWNGGGEITGVLITHNVGCDLVFWSVGYLLLSNAKRVSFDFLMRGPVWSVFIGLSLVWSGAAEYVPEFFKTFLKFAGAAAIPLNLMIFGALMCDMLGRDKIPWKIVISASLVRMGLLPALFIFAAWALPVDGVLKTILVLMALSPSGIMPAVLAKSFGGYPKIAVQIVLATSIIAVFTLPLYLAFGMSVIK